MNYILDRFSYIQCSLTLHTYGIIVILAPPPLRVNPWEAGGL